MFYYIKNMKWKYIAINKIAFGMFNISEADFLWKLEELKLYFGFFLVIKSIVLQKNVPDEKTKYCHKDFNKS